MSAKLDNWVAEIKKWLLERKPGVTELDMSLDLIDNRVLDSLAFLNFILFLEELTGSDVQAQIQSATSLRTLQSIRDDILAPIARGTDQ